MELEEQPPKKSRFGFVVFLTCLALLCFFAIAWLTLRKDHTLPGGYNKHPTTELVSPFLRETTRA